MLAGNIDIRHLTTFLEIARTRAFGRAAEQLGYTQSAVSQQIATLERAVGAPLFHRPGGPRPVELTDAGRVLLTHAQAIVNELADADAALAAFRDGARGNLRVGSFQSVSVKILPHVVQSMASELPGVDIELIESDDGHYLVDLLERRELDATFLVAHTREHGAREQHLFDDPFVAVATPGTLPPGPTRVADLDGLPLIGQHSNDMCQRAIELGVSAAGIEAHYVFKSADNAAVQAMARTGRGIALMPRLAIDVADPTVSIHEVVDIAPRQVIIIWRDTPDVPPAIGRFVTLAVDLTRELAAEPAA